MKLLAENVNALIVSVGLVALLSGITAQWSAAVAAIVAGIVLMVAGSWPYLVRTLRKRA